MDKNNKIRVAVYIRIGARVNIYPLLKRRKNTTQTNSATAANAS